MAEVGNSEIPPKLETPTEASRGFLDKMAHGARETGITIVAGLTPGGVFGLAMREVNRQSRPRPETPQQSPTKASESFMQYYFRHELRPGLRHMTEFPGAIVTEIAGAGAIHTLGGFNIVQDIAEGRWAVAAAKGAIAGVMAVPVVKSAMATFGPSKS